MTANFPSTPADLHAAPAAEAAASSSSSSVEARRRWRALVQMNDRVAFATLVVSLLLLYGLLQNPYWVPAGDSELYTAAARNIARGDGYTFNGQPVAIIPPGWSWMMAMVMQRHAVRSAAQAAGDDVHDRQPADRLLDRPPVRHAAARRCASSC